MRSEKTVYLFKDLIEFFDEMNNTPGDSINSKLGLYPLDYSYEEGTLELAFRVTPFMINTINACHGGILTTVMDMNMGYLAYAMNEHKTAPTSNININFLAPAFLGDMLVAKAWCKKCGSTLVSLTCEVRNIDTRRLIATGSGTFCILK